LRPARALHEGGGIETAPMGHKEMFAMKTLILSSVLALAFVTTGCSKKASQCEQIFDHTVSLVPAEMRDKVKEQKADAIAKCEKLSPEARQCAIDAKDMGALMKCPQS
jgi:hypothetical protein